MTPGDSASDADEKRTTAHKIRNVLHGAKLQLALLELELQGEKVTGAARQAAASARGHVDQLARLIAELSRDNSDEGSP